MPGFKSEFVMWPLWSAKKGGIGERDECEVTIAHGPVQIDETFRVVEIGIDPATGTITPVSAGCRG